LQRVIFKFLIFFSIFVILFSFLFSGEINNFIITAFDNFVEKFESQSIKISYESKKISIFRISVDNISISDEENFFKAEKVYFYPDIVSSLKNQKLIFNIIIQKGKIEADFTHSVNRSNFNLDTFGVSRISFSGTEIDIKFVEYGEIKRFQTENISGIINANTVAGNFVHFTNKIIDIKGTKIGKKIQGSIKIKNASVKRYEQFLKDFESLSYIEGLFNAELEYALFDSQIDYRGVIEFSDTKMVIESYGTHEISDFSGKVEVDGKIRKFINTKFMWKNYEIELSGVRRKKSYADLKISIPKLDNSYIFVNGEDGKWKYNGVLHWNDYLFEINENNIITLTNNSGFDGRFYVDLEKSGGDFRFSYKDKFNLWGNYFFDFEQFIFQTEKSFIRTGKKIFPFSVQNNNGFYLEIEKILNLDFDYKTGVISGETMFSNSVEKISGKADFIEESIFIETEQGYFKFDDKKVELKYFFSFPELTFEKIFAENVEGNLFYNEENYIIEASAEKINFSGYDFNNVKINADSLNNQYKMISDDFKLNLDSFPDYSSGEITNFSKNFDILGVNATIEFNKVKINKKNNNIYITPENSIIKYGDYKFHFNKGEIVIDENGKISCKNIEYVSDRDILILDLEYFDNKFVYEAVLKGDGEYSWKNLFTVKNKVLRVKGENSEYQGTILLDKAVPGFDIPYEINGKIDFDKNRFYFSNIEAKNKLHSIILSGEYNHSKEEFFIDAEAKNKMDFNFKNENIELSIVASGNIIFVKNNHHTGLGGKVNIENGRVYVKKLSENIPDFINRDLEVIFNDLNVNYGKNNFLVNGAFLNNSQNMEKKLNCRIKDGRIDILGNDFKIREGYINTLESRKHTSEGIIRFENNSRLESEYIATIGDIYFDKIYDKENNLNIWIDIMLEKTFGDYNVFGRLSGNSENRNIYFYSQPELPQSKIYDMMKNNSFFSFFEAKDFRDRMLSFIGMDKALFNRFSRELNVESIDIKDGGSGFQINVKKNLGQRATLNYERIIVEETESVGIEYNLGKNLFFTSENDEKESNLKLKWKLFF